MSVKNKFLDQQSITITLSLREISLLGGAYIQALTRAGVNLHEDPLLSKLFTITNDIIFPTQEEFPEIIDDL